MIKGINKQVLEITETSNEYFEKALFFVKPEFSNFPENKLKEIANGEIKNSLIPPKTKINKKETKIKSIILASALFISGLSLGFLISFFIWLINFNMIK